MAESALQITHLPDSVTEVQLRTLFEVFGDTVGVELKKVGRYNVGVIRYRSSSECEQAVDNMDGSEFLGIVLRVRRLNINR